MPRTVQRVVIVKDRPNHILHLILTVLSLGFWLVPWFLISLSYALKRRYHQLRR